MRALRNIAIIAFLALIVAAVPGGGNVADGIMAALMLAFLTLIAGVGFMLYRQNRFAYESLDNTRRAWFLGAFGAVVLAVVGADELLATGAGTLVFIGVLGLAVFAIVRVVSEARSA